MDRYTASSELVTSATADTNTFPLGLITGGSRVAQIYEFLAAIKAAANDSRHLAELVRTSTALTAGTALTPEPLALGRGGAISTISQAPTGGTIVTTPLLRLVFNGRATVRWAAVDPDARIIVPAGGGIGGSLLVANRNSAAAATATLNQLWWAE